MVKRKKAKTKCDCIEGIYVWLHGGVRQTSFAYKSMPPITTDYEFNFCPLCGKKIGRSK